MSDLDNFGEIVCHQVQRITLGQAEAWEKVLRLHIKPKPAWMPKSMWLYLLDLLLIQSDQRIK